MNKAKTLPELRAKSVGNAATINCIYSACGKRIDLHTNRNGSFTIMTYFVLPAGGWGGQSAGQNVAQVDLGVALAKVMREFVGQWISKDNVDDYAYAAQIQFTVAEPHRIASTSKRLPERNLLPGPTL